MSTAYFSFFGRLRDFVRRDQRDRMVTVHFRGRQSIKHLAESLGVPHPEVGKVEVNDREGTLDAITRDQDHIGVYPVADRCPIEPRFVLDGHLGRLTAHLRMLGFDCLYQNDYEDALMAQIVQSEERILLSRDRRLLMRKAVMHGYCLRSLDPMEQLTEVIRRFDLIPQIAPFHRCLRCNHLLQPVSKEAVLDRLEPLTKLYFHEFHICPACKQVYWKGSHYERMQNLIETLQKDQLGT
jgi:uncharacterized protein with PIN domain